MTVQLRRLATSPQGVPALVAAASREAAVVAVLPDHAEARLTLADTKLLCEARASALHYFCRPAADALLCDLSSVPEHQMTSTDYRSIASVQTLFSQHDPHARVRCLQWLLRFAGGRAGRAPQPAWPHQRRPAAGLRSELAGARARRARQRAAPQRVRCAACRQASSQAGSGCCQCELSAT